MTTRFPYLIHALFIAALIILVPSTARVQEKSEPTATQQPEKAADQPVKQETAVAPEPQQPADATAPSETGEYVIKQGDTLWDIAQTYLKDPFLWPFIWKANQTIMNPDLIYPGSKLAIPNLGPVERAMAAVSQPAPEKKIVEKETVAPAGEKEKAPATETAAPPPPAAQEEPVPEPVQPLKAKPSQPVPAVAEEEVPAARKLIMPEETVAPVMDRYSMLNAGYVNSTDTTDMIVSSVEQKTIMGYDDLVNVRIKDREHTNIGDRFLIYQPLKKVKHPITGKEFGRLIKVFGIVKIVDKDSPDTLTGRITLSFDALEPGSLVTPYQEPVLVYDAAQKKTKDISGYILEVMDNRSVSSQTDIVYLDKGSLDGVDAGDRFSVYADANAKIFARRVIGELQVFLVKEHSSTAVVRRSIDGLAKGDRIEFKK